MIAARPVLRPAGHDPALLSRHGWKLLNPGFKRWSVSLWAGTAARPIARLDVDDSQLRFAIPPQWERAIQGAIILLAVAAEARRR
jgi:hypothetical protein